MLLAGIDEAENKVPTGTEPPPRTLLLSTARLARSQLPPRLYLNERLSPNQYAEISRASNPLPNLNRAPY